jgi:hypothetical protein
MTSLTSPISLMNWDKPHETHRLSWHGRLGLVFVRHARPNGKIRLPLILRETVGVGSGRARVAHLWTEEDGPEDRGRQGQKNSGHPRKLLIANEH